MNYILGIISVIMFGGYASRVVYDSDNAHDHYSAAFYFAAAIVCFVLY
jgi:hypothetical protein